MLLKIIKIFIPTVLLAALVILFLPLAFPRQFFIDTSIYYQGSVDKVIDYNPFYPVIAANQDVGVLDFLYFKRTGIFSFEKIKTESASFTYGVTKTELQSVLNKYDLRKETPDETKFTPVTTREKNMTEFYSKQMADDKKLFEEMAKPEVCRDGFGVHSDGFKISYFQFLGLNSNALNVREILQKNNVENVGITFSTKTNTYEISIKEAKPFKIIIYYAADFKSNPETKITKLVLVDRDCNQTQIPTKPDGTFDFEAVRSKWE